MKTEKKDTIDINPALAFQFLGVKDYGSTCCPHCGADGRYIYSWAEYGVVHSAMAGCYAQLTGRLAKSDYDKFFENLSKKQASGKPLSGYQKTVARMQQFIQEGRYSAEWCEQKIKEAIQSHYQYAANYGRR